MLQDRETADKAKQERIKQIQNRIAAINGELERVATEIAEIEGPEKECIAALQGERLEAYTSYFRNLQEEAKTLESLYEPIRQRLNERALLDDNPLEFSIRWDTDLKKWLERGSGLFDQRRAIPYGTFDKLGEAARRIMLPALSSGDPDRISLGWQLRYCLSGYGRTSRPHHHRHRHFRQNGRRVEAGRESRGRGEVAACSDAQTRPIRDVSTTSQEKGRT